MESEIPLPEALSQVRQMAQGSAAPLTGPERAEESAP
jgi:hypothetical protein